MQYPPLWSVLCALLIIALAMRDDCMARAALVLLANWCANTMLATATGDQFLWPCMILTDAISALILLWLPLTKWQAAIALTYVVEIIAHSAYGLTSEGVRATWNYYWTLFYIAWAQAGILLLWSSVDGAKSAWRARRLRHSILSVPSMFTRSGEP